MKVAALARLVPVLLALAGTSCLSACDVNVSFGGSRASIEGNGIEHTEERVLPPFSGVKMMGVGRLEVRVGEGQSVSLTCDENLATLISTEVEDDRLLVRPTESIDPEVDLVVRVTVPELKSVRSSGAGSIDVTGLDEDELHVRISGAAAVDLDGRVDRLTIELSGVGSVSATDLIAREAAVRVSGVGKADVHATERLEARVSGVGRIAYAGEPVVEKQVSGLGAVSQL